MCVHVCACVCMCVHVCALCACVHVCTVCMCVCYVMCAHVVVSAALFSTMTQGLQTLHPQHTNDSLLSPHATFSDTFKFVKEKYRSVQ